MRPDTLLRYHTEFIGGLEIEKPLPKELHAIIQMYLLLFFQNKLSVDYRALPELNVICSLDRIVPDLTVFRRSARFMDGDLADPPLLAVEISSPGQGINSLVEKCGILANCGTPMCWIVDPENRRAWTFSNFELAEVVEFLDVDLSTSKMSSSGLRVSLAAMWLAMDSERSVG